VRKTRRDVKSYVSTSPPPGGTAAGRTLVVGLGNPILTDDGVGVKVARAVAARLASSHWVRSPHLCWVKSPHLCWVRSPTDTPPVDVVEASVGGLRLMEMMIGYQRVIVIDALYHPDVAPGTLHRMTRQDLERVTPHEPEHLASAHDASLLTALETGQRLGLTLPDEVVIYAIGVQDVLTFGETLTPAVAQAVPAVVEAVVKEI
jgi:hydrogenase maturation protease